MLQHLLLEKERRSGSGTLCIRNVRSSNACGSLGAYNYEHVVTLNCIELDTVVHVLRKLHVSLTLRGEPYARDYDGERVRILV